MNKLLILLSLVSFSSSLFALDNFDFEAVINPTQADCDEIKSVPAEIQATINSNENERDAAFEAFLKELDKKPKKVISKEEAEKEDMQNLVESYGVKGAIKFWIERTRSLKCLFGTRYQIDE